MISLLLSAMFLSSPAQAKVEYSLDTLTNVARNAILEACGTAKDDTGNPVHLVVTHAGGKTSTLSDPKTGKWCVLFARRTMDGNTKVEAVGSEATPLMQFLNEDL